MRKLGLLLTLWTALLVFPLSSFALGLGEIETNSFLNQPLKAEIQVISARAGEIDDLLVSLASRDSFRKAGLERPSSLSKLKFRVEKSEDGQSAVIHVSTKQAIKEPFLNFLLEADWAKGRLLREFTVLLDPPYFNQQTSEPAQQVSEQQESTASVQNQPDQSNLIARDNIPAGTDPVARATQRDEPASQPIALSQQASERQQTTSTASGGFNSSASSDEIVVGKGDTLWGLASKFKDEAHSMAQVMLAMQVMNPDAFGRDNINNLKVGSVLRAPDMQTIDNLTKQEAYAQVLEQNGLWDEYVSRKTGAPVAGSPVASTSGSTSSEQSQGQLSLLTPGDGDSESASQQDDANSKDSGQIRKRLALAEEELEAARVENNDLSSRIASLENQLQKFEELQKLVQIEDSSLAQLQNETAKQQPIEAETTSTMAGEVEEQPSNVMIEAAKDLMTDQPSESSVAGPKMAEAETVIETLPEQQASNMQNQDVTDSQSPPPAPVIITENPDSIGSGVQDALPSVGDILEDPVMLGAAGGIIALLIGFLLFKRRKTEDDFGGITLEEPSDAANVDDDATPIHIPSIDEESGPAESAPKDGAFEETNVLDTVVKSAAEVEEEDEFAKTAIIAGSDMPEAEAAPVQEDQDDVLNEVDVYLAYGLYDNAEDLLNESIQSNPDRADYRAKLLDTYFATKNKDAFVKEADNLRSLGGGADRFWDRVQTMGYELAPENDLFSDAQTSNLSVADLEYAKPQTADFDFGNENEIEESSDTDFNLGEDSFDLSDLSSTQEIATAEDTLTETLGMGGVSDIELPGLDDEETVIREEEQPETMGIPDSIGDFDLDFDTSDEQSEEGTVGDEDAISFDLPDDLDFSVDDAISDLQSDDETESEAVIEKEAEVETAIESDGSLESIDGDDLDISSSVETGDDLTASDSGDIELDLGELDSSANDITNEVISEESTPVLDVAHDEDDNALFAAEESEVELDLGDLSGENSDVEASSVEQDEQLEVDVDSEENLDNFSETLVVPEGDIASLDIEDNAFNEDSEVANFDEATSETLVISPDELNFSEAMTDLESEDDIDLDFGEIDNAQEQDDDLSALDIDDGLDEIISNDILSDTQDEGTMHLESALDVDMSDFAEPENTTSDQPKIDDEDQGTMHVEAALDLDMSDLQDASLNVAAAEIDDEVVNLDDNELSSELTEEIGSLSDLDLSDLDVSFGSDTDDSEIGIMEEVDVNAGLDKTGTFAPGDFSEDIAESDSDDMDSDDIEGLMLPDDVDEVATKLDLAKAFIDMGDAEGARSSLEEVMTEGSDDQKEEATGLLSQIK